MMAFVEVTREEFHATVGQMDVHPRAERDASYWETRHRVLMGKTTPGYMGKKPGEPKRYYVWKESA
jgi:ribosomal protein S6E (S10)